MNGAVYISFFQGQLESVLEQVVQLAVQEISKTVGSSLNAMLLETAVKEQENRRLRLQIQSRESDEGPGAAARSKAGEERQEGGRTQQTYATGGQGSDRGLHSDTRRLEQRGRVVEQLKAVMERVLDFAVGELTKIVEASFDDLLLEITKMEREKQSLEERLGLGAERGERPRGDRGRRRGSENDSMSPSGSEDNREETSETTKGPQRNHGGAHASSQDWVPILDKVFGQKWCRDVWHVQELEGGVSVETGAGGCGSAVVPPLSLEPRPSSPQQDPRWTPLEDMEVFSPDEDEATPSITTATSIAVSTTTTTTNNSSTPSATVSVRSSSASMLHRLLTLPSQLLEEDDREDNNDAEALANVSMPTNAGAVEMLPPATKEEEDEDGEEEDRGSKKKRRRVWTECEDCGRRFSRVSLLKAHRQSHVAESSSPPLNENAASSLSCAECGKRFSSNTRLQSHVRTSHGNKLA